MARPSVQRERREEILDAFERCIIKYGVDGAGLQKIADEAGLARPLIRHHVGNREALLDSLVERFIARSDALVAETEAALPAEGRVDVLLDILFSPEYQTSQHATALYQSLSIAAQTRPALLDQIKRWNDDFYQFVRSEVAAHAPNAAAVAIDEVAWGILAVYFNADSMAHLTGNTELLVRSRGAAGRLLASI